MNWSDFFGSSFVFIVNVVGYILKTVTWKSFFVLVAVCTSFYVLRKIQKQKNNKFDAIDYLLDDQTEKASLSKLILLLFAIASAYIIIFNIPVSTELVLGILTIFVLKEEAKRYITKDQVVSSSTVTKTTEETRNVRPVGKGVRPLVSASEQIDHPEHPDTIEGVQVVEAPAMVIVDKEKDKKVKPLIHSKRKTTTKRRKRHGLK